MTTLSPIDVSPLRQAHRGPVVAPGDEGWDAARAAWNVSVDQNPAAVALAAGAEDVAAAVAFARRSGVGVRVQGTGHGAIGTLEGTLLVDTSRMRAVSIDPEARTARVEAGALWDDVRGPAGAHGLAGLSGSTPYVSVAGYALGGGLGWLGRRHGFAANSVIAIEIVTADGERRRVDAETDPDLFWALRGGGGSFGAVTALELRLYPVAEAFAGNLFWPIERTREVLDAYREWVDAVPVEVTSTFRILRLPPIPQVPEPLRGGEFVNVLAAFLGSEAEGAELVRPLREVAAAFLDTFATIPAPALADIAGDPEDPLPALGTDALLGALTPESADALVSVAGPRSGCPLLQVELRQLGGALAEARPDGGAIGALDAAFLLLAVGVPMGPHTPARLQEALAELRTAIAPWTTGRRYFNFVTEEAPSRELFEGEAHARLVEIRRRVDPDGLFRPNLPISDER